MTVFFDILYWIAATVLVFALLCYTSEGEFHYYDVLGFGIGAFLWRMGPGKAARFVHTKLTHALRALFSRLKGTALFKLLNR